MQHKHGYLLLTVIVLLAILFILRIFIRHRDRYEHMIDIAESQGRTYSQCKCTFKLPSLQRQVFEDNNYVPVKDREGAIMVPCSYNSINNEISKMPKTSDGKYFVIDNADQISSKSLMWKNIVTHHGLEKAKLLSPDTFILSDSSDVQRLKDSHYAGKKYIMKKNIQRQLGLFITDDIDQIIRDKGKYVVVQELLQNPYTVGGRKINLRVYILVVCMGGNVYVYAHKDGFMYYTPNLYVKGDTSRNNIITTGYIDRKVYEENPLTHQDFRDYLDSDRPDLTVLEKSIKDQGLKLSTIIFNRIYRMLSDVFVCLKGRFCRKGNKLENNLSYQLFGADVAINEELQAQIMEVNKGPDMGSKGPRDRELKYNVLQDTLKIIGGAESRDNNFVKILEVNGDCCEL